MSNAVISSSSSVASSTGSQKQRACKAAAVVSVQRMQCFKTKRCRFWLEGRCTRGNSCTYAHTDVELRVPPNLTKTKICARWRRGTCENSASDCAYAHGQDDMRETAPDSPSAAMSHDFSTRSSGSTLGSFESSLRSSPRTDEEAASDDDEEDGENATAIIGNNNPEVCDKTDQMFEKLSMAYYYAEDRDQVNERAFLGACDISYGSDMGPICVLHSLTMFYTD